MVNNNRELQILIVRSDIEIIQDVLLAKDVLRRYAPCRAENFARESIKAARAILKRQNYEQMKAMRELQKFDAQFMYEEYIVNMLCEIEGSNGIERYVRIKNCSAVQLWKRDTSRKINIKLHPHFPKALTTYMEVVHEVRALHGNRVEAFILKIHEGILDVLKNDEAISCKQVPEKEELIRRIEELFELIPEGDEEKTFEYLMEERLDECLSWDPEELQKSLQKLPNEREKEEMEKKDGNRTNKTNKNKG